MNRRAYLVASGIIFGIVAVLHLLRVGIAGPSNLDPGGFPCGFHGSV